MPDNVVTNQSTGDLLKATSLGTLNNKLQTTQVISFNRADKYFRNQVTLKNVGVTPIDSVRFMRNFDPDNTVFQGGSYNTHNTIPFTQEAGDGKAVVALAQDRDHDVLAPNATRDHYGIPNDIVSLGHLGNWSRHLLNIVTETFYDINRTGFVSEKIYKPIVGCRPFLVCDPDGGTQWLCERGFELYTQDFQDISDLNLAQPHNIPKFLAALCEQTPVYWQKKFVDLQEKIQYNKAHFADYVTRQQSIVKQGIPCPI
jgi:hypothetical protein